MFFGTSLSIIEHVKKYVKVWKPVKHHKDSAPSLSKSHSNPVLSMNVTTPLLSQSYDDYSSTYSNGHRRRAATNTMIVEQEDYCTYQLESLDGTVYDSLSIPVKKVHELNYLNIHDLAVKPHSHDNTTPPASSLGTRFLILDFDNVNGIDATAIRSCFFNIKKYK